MVVLFLFLILFGFLIYVLYRKRNNGICKSKKRLDGMTCVVTGGTSGIGLEISIDFASRGARVIVACPFVEEGIDAEKKIIEESGNSNVIFKLLDLGSFDSVRQFAADILNTEEHLDILMNNAGISSSSKTNDNVKVLMVNYLGHFLLTLLLLPLLTKSGTPSAPSRVVNTTSIMHRLARIDAGNLTTLRDGLYGKFLIYANSKLCLVLFSRGLNKRLLSSNVVINNADPGEVGTGIFLNGGFTFLYFIYVICWCFAKTPFEGAQTAIHVALDEKAGQKSGQLYRDCKPCGTASAGNDEELATKVWEKSVELVKLGDEELKKILQ